MRYEFALDTAADGVFSCRALTMGAFHGWQKALTSNNVTLKKKQSFVGGMRRGSRSATRGVGS